MNSSTGYAQVEAGGLKGPEESVYSAPHLLAFVLLWGLAQAAAVLVHQPDVLAGAQVDADGYMRLVRVHALLETGDWFNSTVERSNWPYGESHHWTRPLDVVIIALALPFRLFMNTPEAVAVAGALISPLCHLAICVAAVWVIYPVVPGQERFLAMPAMLAQPGLLAYGSAGRADHHALIFLLFLLALGAWLRVLLDPRLTRSAFLAGMLAGVGIWVGPESLLPLAVMFASGGLAWVIDGNRMAAANRWLCLGLVAGVTFSIIIERTPSLWLAPAFDQISVAHLVMSLIALGFWGLAPLAGWADSWIRRGGVAAIGAVTSAGALLVLYPSFLRGPWADVDPDVVRVWLQHVEELQPLFPADASLIGRYIIFMAPAALFIPAVASWLRRDRKGAFRHVWILFLLSLAVYIPLASVQMRFSAYSGIMFGLLAVELLRRSFARIAALQRPSHAAILRVAAMTGVFLGSVLLGGAAGIVLGDSEMSAGDPNLAGGGCDIPAISIVLADPEGLGARPATIAAFIDFGPELLYRTPHRVLAGPYHRNYQGILAAYSLMTTSDSGDALRIVRERGVDLLLICPAVDQPYYGAREDAFYNTIRHGALPSWLRRFELPYEESAFEVFVVVD